MVYVPKAILQGLQSVHRHSGCLGNHRAAMQQSMHSGHLATSQWIRQHPDLYRLGCEEGFTLEPPIDNSDLDDRVSPEERAVYRSIIGQGDITLEGSGSILDSFRRQDESCPAEPPEEDPD